MPAKSMCAVASYAALLASATVAPVPTTFRMRPPFVTSRPSWSAVPAWKTSAPVASAASIPSIGVPWSPRSGYSPPESTTVTAARSADLRLLREVAGEQRQQVAVEPREQRLRLGIAEAAVELDHAQPVLGPHQPRVEEALERRAAAGELAEHRQVHGLEDLCRLRVGDVGQRREGAHAAGVRAGVAVPDPLVVAGRREGDGGLAGGEGEDGQLGPLEELLDVEGLVERLRDLERRVELVLRAADPDALAGREPVELDDAGRPGDGQRPRGRHAGGSPSPPWQMPSSPRSARPRRSGRRRRCRDGAARRRARRRAAPRGRRRRGRSGARARARRARRGRRRARGGSAASAAIPGLPGSGVQLVEVGAAGERPGERVLATSRPDDEHPHPAIVRNPRLKASADLRKDPRHMYEPGTQPARVGERVADARGRSPHRSGPGTARARPARGPDARGERLRAEPTRSRARRARSSPSTSPRTRSSRRRSSDSEDALARRRRRRPSTATALVFDTSRHHPRHRRRGPRRRRGRRGLSSVPEPGVTLRP